MKKAWVISLFAVLASLPALGQTAAFNGNCTEGGIPSLTSGLPSSNRLLGVIPHCTVSVYLTGTTTLATIYSDANNTTLTNPFTATPVYLPNSGSWLFYAATGQGYDVVMSGGDTPLTYTSPVTLTDLIIESGGGGSSFTASVNGTPLIVSGSANLINSPSITVTNPSTNQIQLTAVNPFTPIVIQHNDSASGVNQATLDFNDTIPAPPTGNESVTFQNDLGTGRLSGYVPIPSLTSMLQPLVDVPPDGSYSTAIIYPTIGTVTSTSPITDCVAAAGTSSGQIIRIFGSPIGGSDCTIQWSGFSLPASIDPATVVQITPFIVGSIIGYPVESGFVTFGCTDGTIHGGPWADAGSVLPLGTYSANASGGTPVDFDYATATCTLDDIKTTGGGAINIDNATSVGMIIYYTGTTIEPTEIQVAPPLYFNVTTNTLGLSLPFDFAFDTGTTDAFVVNLPALYPATSAGLEVKFLPKANNTSSTPTLNVDSNSAITIVKAGGAALAANDLTTTAIADVILGNSGHWELQNPQTAITGTNISGGALGSVPYQSAPDTTAVSAANTSASTLCFTETGTGSAGAIPTWGSCAGSAATAFSAITASTNTSAAMLVGTGASLGPTGSGVVNANQVNAGTIPASKTIVGTNSSSQFVDASAATLANDTTGTAAKASALAASPSVCSGGQFATGIAANGNASCATPSGTPIVLSTTGGSGAATFSSPNLNIPVYAGAGVNANITQLTGITTPLTVAQGGTGTNSGTGYVYGNGTSPHTYSTTIPGTAVAGNISGSAANVYGTPTLPTGVKAATCTLGEADANVATNQCVVNAVAGGTKTICSGTITLTGGAIAPGAKVLFTATCTGLLTTDNISLDFNADPTGTTGFIPSTNGMLTIIKFPTANTINVYEVNNTSQNPASWGTVTANFHVYR